MNSEKKVRTFKVKLHNEDNTKFRGRFTGKTPQQAGKKALTSLLKESGKKTGKINFDSINEKARHKITIMPMDFQIIPIGPETKIMGTNAAMVVNTPKVAGMATRLTPRITLSICCPFLSHSSWALSPITMASSTTKPIASTKANNVKRFIE